MNRPALSLFHTGRNTRRSTTRPTRVRLRLELLERRSLPAGVFQFSAGNFYAGENGASALITVTRTGDVSGSSSVNFATSDGTATSGKDYTTSSGTLTFAANVTSKTFSVPTKLDAEPDGNETVNVSLNNPTNGATLGSPGTAILTILDASVGFAETEITKGLNSPVSMAVAPDGRVFVTQQGGALRVIENGVLLSTPFVTVPTTANDEEGLLSVAFDPNFGTNRFVYVAYTFTTPNRHQVIVRYTSGNGANQNTAVPGSEVTIFSLHDNSIPYHLGAAMHFGPDGKLYYTTGESGGDPGSLSSLAGKLLRLNADGSIPDDNPYFNDPNVTGIYKSIYARGFRNPFTSSIHPVTGRIFVNDVGANAWEEVNDVVPTGHYGWPTYEGPFTPPNPNPNNYQSPLHSYDHGDGCAITGGAFYHPPTSSFPPGYTDKYFYLDFCSNEIRWIDPANPGVHTVFRSSVVIAPVDIRGAPDGSLYYLSRANPTGSGGGNVPGGTLRKISFTGNLSPSIASHPASALASVGHSATFSVAANGTPPLTYQWQKNGVDIPSATQASYTTPPATLADEGTQFRVIVTNSHGSVASNAATLSVTTDQPPAPTILTPTAGTTYTAGTALSFSGNASDPEDGTLPASAFTWWIDLHHDSHSHPRLAPISGITNGTWPIPSQEETSANVHYRLNLRVTDSAGLSTTVSRNILPVTSTFTLTTSAPGLQLTLDGQPVATGTSVLGVVGIERVLGAPPTQTAGGRTYYFIGWSDGGARTHAILTPAANTTYTATYRPIAFDAINIVNWGGDYVDDDTAMQRYSTPVQSGLTLDGVGTANDYRWHLPYSDVNPINPNPSGGNAYGGTYSQGTSWRFYGGALFHSYNADFLTRYVEVWGNPPPPDDPANEHIYLHAGSSMATDGWLFLNWKKADFLSGATFGRVLFTQTSALTVENYSGSVGVPSENSGRLRFAVRDGNRWYMSQDFAGPSGSVATFSLTDPNSRLWAPYRPTAPFGVKFNWATAAFQPHVFTDIQGVGVYHSNDNSTAPDRHAGINFARFQVVASLARSTSSNGGPLGRSLPGSANAGEPQPKPGHATDSPFAGVPFRPSLNSTYDNSVFVPWDTPRRKRMGILELLGPAA